MSRVIVRVNPIGVNKMNGMYSLTSLLMLYSLFSRSVATLGNQPSHVTPEDGPVKDYTGLVYACVSHDLQYTK